MTEQEQPPESGSRREFFAKLVTMTFLTAGILRTGPLALGQHGQQADPSCTAQGDLDCAPTGNDTIDQDCNLPNPEVPGGYNQDNDCAVGVNKDGDCGSFTGENEGAKHEDSDCSPNSADNDCGGNNNSESAPGTHTDSCCLPGGGSTGGGGAGRDSACGVDNGSGYAAADGDCTAPQPNASDDDCGKVTTGGASDSNCAPGNADGDCNESGSDQDCSYSGADEDCVTPNGGDDTLDLPLPPW
jgi:hypothetical protein